MGLRPRLTRADLKFVHDSIEGGREEGRLRGEASEHRDRGLAKQVQADLANLAARIESLAADLIELTRLRDECERLESENEQLRSLNSSLIIKKAARDAPVAAESAAPDVNGKAAIVKPARTSRAKSAATEKDGEAP